MNLINLYYSGLYYKNKFIKKYNSKTKEDNVIPCYLRCGKWYYSDKYYDIENYRIFFDENNIKDEITTIIPYRYKIQNKYIVSWIAKYNLLKIIFPKIYTKDAYRKAL